MNNDIGDKEKKRGFVLVWSDDHSHRSMVAYGYQPEFRVRLPSGNKNTSLIYLSIQIRDLLNGVTNYPLNPILVRTDKTEVTSLVQLLQQSRIQLMNNNPTIRALASGNPNVVGQVLTTVSQVFNQINRENIDQAIASQ